MEFETLTRKHGFKVSPLFPCSVEECSVAVAKVVGAASVKSAARMNGGVVIFVDEVEKANTVVANGVVIKDTFVSVMPLATPATKVLLSNIPPFISDQLIVKELARFGKVVSPVKRLASGCKSPELKHVVSHRRMLFMILNDRTREMNITFKLTVDGFDYTLYATTDKMKCFGCGEENHLIRSCPQRPPTAASAGARGKGGRRGAPWGRPATAGDGEVVGQGGEAEGGNGDNGLQEKVGGGGEEVEGGGPEADQPTADKENVLLSAKEDSGPSTSQVEEGGSVESGGAGVEGQLALADVDMGGEEENLKVGRQKRKANCSDGSQAKKVTAEEKQNDSESDGWENDDEGCYELSEMKQFLQKTKNERCLKIEKHFPGKMKFVKSAKLNMKKQGRGALTQQEICRLKKMITKVNQELNVVIK